MDLVEYLESKGLQIKSAPSGNIYTHCWYCNEDESKPGRLYIQADVESEMYGAHFCLAAETRVVTRSGTYEIGDLAGQEVELLCRPANGRKIGFWRKAPVRSFGTQSLYALTLQRNGVTKTIRCTPEHRWFVEGDASALTTLDLKVGQRLASNVAQSVFSRGVKLNHHGIVRGFIYGDGTLSSKTSGSVARLYGDKDASLKQFFSQQLSDREGFSELAGFPKSYKTDLPDLDETTSYLVGWLAGYFAADGSFTGSACSPKLYSADKSNLEYVRELCTVLGIRTHGVTSYARKGYGSEKTYIYALTIVADDLGESFFLIDSHKSRFLEQKATARGSKIHWKVVSVEDLEIQEEVFCATVDGVGNFTLEDNLLTGNCHLCQSKGGLNSIRRHFGDEPIGEAEFNGNMMRVATDYYAARLLENIEAYEYLQDERGLTHEKILEMKLGWADGGLLTHLLAEGFELEDIQASGLVNHMGDDFLRQKITIPYLEYGQPVAIRGKQIGGKYLSLPGSHSRLYGHDSVRGQDTVIITAGEFDAAVLQQLGFNAAGAPGENQWKGEWTELLVDAKRIYIMFDSDTAGKAGAEKLATTLGPRSRVVELPPPPPGKKKTDVSNLYVQKNYTKEDFEFLISKAKGGLLISPAQSYDRWLEFEGNPTLEGLRFNIAPIDNEMAHGLLPGQVVTLLARTNCLVGDTDLIVNRAGKSFHITLEELVRKFNGGKPRGGRSWDQSIPTKVQRRADDGTVRLVEIQDAWCSGVKEVYRLWTVCGRDIKATAQHPFLTDEGYKQLGDLSPGDQVYVNVGKSQTGSTPRQYKAKSGLHYHPYRTKRTVYPGNTAEKSTVQLHRLVAEAQLNHMSLEDFLHRCRRGPVDDLNFINPATHVVHHMDGDYTNNDPGNLSVLTHEVHNVVHGYHVGNVLDRTELTEIAGIEYLGEEVTYDIEVVDDPHNFIANEFVVHNTGKTLFSLNVLHRMRMKKPDIKILFLSLEQMRNEWFERAHKIHSFYEPGVTTLDTVNYWKDNLFIVDENRISEEVLEMCIDQYVYETGSVPDLVLIDYLGYYARSFQGEEYARTTSAIMGLKALAKQYQLVFLAPHQANRSNDMGSEVRLDQGRGAGTVEETSDVSLALWNPDQRKSEKEGLITRADQKKELILKMSKSRDGGVNTMCLLQMAPLTLAIVPQGDEHYERALRERQYWVAGMSHKDAIRAYLTGNEEVRLNIDGKILQEV